MYQDDTDKEVDVGGPSSELDTTQSSLVSPPPKVTAAKKEKRQRKKSSLWVGNQNITELPPEYRPPEWLTATVPRKAPYVPQMGDEVMYFMQVCRIAHTGYKLALVFTNLVIASWKISMDIH